MLPSDCAGHVLVAGSAHALGVVLLEPLSFWGGFDPITGQITDVHHPQHGLSIANSIVVMTSGRGSSSASSVIAEAVRLGTAPAGFVLTDVDEIIVLGCLVGHELYNTTTPVLVLDPERHAMIRNGQPLTITTGGGIRGG